VTAACDEILRYNDWANTVVIETCRSLSDTALDTVFEGAGRSIRDLLVHLVDGQRVLLSRVEGGHTGEGYAGWAGFDRLAADARRSGEAWSAAVAVEGLDGSVVLPYGAESYRFPGAFFLAHAMAHAAEHRTQILMALAALGIERPDLDGWAFARAMGYGELVAGAGEGG
jgi:uncharacterized damage-inducible protein DinB